MTTPTDAQAPPTPEGVVAGARESIGDLGDVLWAAKAPAELLATKQEIERLRSVLAAVDAVVCHEIEGSRAHEHEQYAAAHDYVTAVAGGYAGSGRRSLRTARDLCGERAATLEALSAGSISAEHAEVICRCIRKLPVDAELRDAGERFLLDHAGTLNATELKTVGRELLEVLDPDGSTARGERELSRQERAAHLNRFFTITRDRLGGARVRGRGSAEDAAVLEAALSALTGPGPSADAGSDSSGATDGCGTSSAAESDYSTRQWDAMIELAQRGLDSKLLPACHGVKPRVGITIDFDTMRNRVGAGLLDTGERLSASAVRRLACDADIYPIVLGSRSQILDVGRSQRLVPLALWLALIARDRHCCFPGCRRPPIACDAHHIRHWVDGGPTCLANTCLLCARHHTMVHNTGWDIAINPVDGRPDFRPPAHLDPDRRPIRERCPRE
ncbi:MAG TPA: DUF222 domain-containing protein [Nocardioidaceae bacterium]|nr:DUF222 domain-containing protein [Nocardioidaceae bacterium]